jgi:hypothetical protein
MDEEDVAQQAFLGFYNGNRRLSNSFNTSHSPRIGPELLSASRSRP